MKCGDCKLWVKDYKICGNPDSPYCAGIKMHYERCGKWKGEWELNEWGSPRDRNRLMLEDRESGMTYKALGKKYEISTTRARLVCLGEVRLRDWEKQRAEMESE